MARRTQSFFLSRGEWWLERYGELWGLQLMEHFGALFCFIDYNYRALLPLGPVPGFYMVGYGDLFCIAIRSRKRLWGCEGSFVKESGPPRFPSKNNTERPIIFPELPPLILLEINICDATADVPLRSPLDAQECGDGFVSITTCPWILTFVLHGFSHWGATWFDTRSLGTLGTRWKPLYRNFGSYL